MSDSAIEEAFVDSYDREPAVVASAPGRVNLVGGHTDYNEGFVLPMAVDLRTAVAVAPRTDDRIRLRSTDVGEAVVVDGVPTESIAGDSTETWANYPLGVVRELAAADLTSPGGVDLLVSSDIPRGAGLSSSAALEVGTAAALYALEHGVDADLPRRALAEAAWRAETEFVGLDCGILDQYASALCEADAALFLDCRSRETESVPFQHQGVRVAVIDTRVEHELATSAYNDRVAECREAATRLDELVGDVASLRDVTRDDFLAHADDLPGALRRRVRHVVTENERVQTACTALRVGALETVGEAMFGSHGSLRDDYEVSCRELDAVVDIAEATDGVLGARMTGGGFGGSVVALVNDDVLDRFRDRLDREYPDRVDTDRTPELYVCQPDAGVRLGV